MIDRAVTCMMAFLPLPEKEAEPIFSHYFHGLAFIAKSDIYYNLDQTAWQAFIFSLFEALRTHGAGTGPKRTRTCGCTRPSRRSFPSESIGNCYLNLSLCRETQRVFPRQPADREAGRGFISDPGREPYVAAHPGWA